MKTEFDQQFSEGYFPGWPVSILLCVQEFSEQQRFFAFISLCAD